MQNQSNSLITFDTQLKTALAVYSCIHFIVFSIVTPDEFPMSQYAFIFMYSVFDNMSYGMALDIHPWWVCCVYVHFYSIDVHDQCVYSVG